MDICCRIGPLTPFTAQSLWVWNATVSGQGETCEEGGDSGVPTEFNVLCRQNMMRYSVVAWCGSKANHAGCLVNESVE